jgi:hypothetical protein
MAGAADLAFVILFFQSLFGVPIFLFKLPATFQAIQQYHPLWWKYLVFPAIYKNLRKVMKSS